ncbi:hypothetical protein BJ878DRAFT_574796 [Calycina marina]|uniref:Uncharacterized protein n=1 Tax=Calycina marina TaxID=1763456 RepID=A0A9P7Z556_9HELO|nr:hypothetical protein BJ878DRAFT_574796 [Calycina marina]
MATPTSINNSALRYTIDKLLRMQSDIAVPKYIVPKLRERWEIGDILRLPRNRTGRPLTSEGLIDVTNTNRPSTIRLGKLRSVCSSSEGLENLAPVNLNGKPHQVSWHLRQRDSSGSSTQPQSAPVALAAQQSENFQRFYRAVVSPTHVRVTAGGRIVPNTRSQPPPEWKTPKLTFEPTPAMPASNAPTVASRHSEDTAVNSQKSTDDDQHAKSDVNMDSSLTQGARPIKISPPDQFDHTKPFMYNGQLVYPLPHGMQPPLPALAMPYSMIGNPSFVPPHLAGLQAVHPTQFPFQMTPLGQIHQLQAGHNGAGVGLFPGAMPLETVPHLPPFIPGPGIPAVSELTKHQMQIYRNHLKFIENQLANNKHQIDEAHMDHQRREVLATIDKMESMLTVQLAHEYNASGKGYLNGPVHSNSSRQASSARSRDERSSATESSTQDVTPMFAKPPKIAVHMTAATDKYNEKGKFGEPKPNGVENLPVIKVSQSETGVKSRLTAAAAKAPPFQPRAQTFVATGQLDGFRSDMKSDVATASRVNLDLRLPTGVTAASSSASSTAGATYGTGSLPEARAVEPPATQRPETFHSVSAAWNNLNFLPPVAPQPIPYLVGLLPQGLSASQATSMDLIYQRELTPDEIRARHIYWGKAPPPASGTLPKFDGRNFYPPSPVKSSAQPMAKPPICEKASPVNASIMTSSEIDGENLFLDPPKSFKMTTPLRARTSMPKTFLNGANVGSPTPRFPRQNNLVASTGLDAGTLINKSEFTPLSPPRISKDIKKSASVDFSNLFLSSTSKRPIASAGVGIQGESAASQHLAEDQSTPGSAPINLSTNISFDNSATASRIDSGKSDQQSLLLQNMLRNTAMAALAATAPSLKVQSTTAQGYLPAYRGSAAASLSSPTFPENNPPRVASSSDLSRGGAEDYMRYIAGKTDHDQNSTAGGGWNESTDAIGPIIGSDW